MTEIAGHCRDCEHYGPNGVGYWINYSVCKEQCPGYEDPRSVPEDGSGYCHEFKRRPATVDELIVDPEFAERATVK